MADVLGPFEDGPWARPSSSVIRSIGRRSSESLMNFAIFIDY